MLEEKSDQMSNLRQPVPMMMTSTAVKREHEWVIRQKYNTHMWNGTYYKNDDYGILTLRDDPIFLSQRRSFLH